MAVKSMTGFGRGEVGNGNRVWSVEVRGVNNRYLDVKIKLPRGYTILEDRIRVYMNEFFQRGRVDLVIVVNGDFSDLVEVTVNHDLALRYKQALDEIAAKCDVDFGTFATTLAAFPDVLVREQKSEDVENEIWPILYPAIQVALAECDVMRLQEGASLQEDLEARLDYFSATIDEIQTRVPVLVQQREVSIKERLDKLLDNVQLDPMRLAQEVALLADKTDVTEEIVRLRSHINQFKQFMPESGAVGRKLDFLIQEFLREVNTIASKINDATIAHLTVGLKSELEKMREQVQNIE